MAGHKVYVEGSWIWWGRDPRISQKTCPLFLLRDPGSPLHSLWAYQFIHCEPMHHSFTEILGAPFIHCEPMGIIHSLWFWVYHSFTIILGAPFIHCYLMDILYCDPGSLILLWSYVSFLYCDPGFIILSLWFYGAPFIYCDLMGIIHSLWSLVHHQFVSFIYFDPR